MRTSITSVQMRDLVEKKMLEWVSASKEFTAYDVTDALRQDYPTVDVPHLTVRSLVQDVFAGLIDYTSESRPYDDGQGSTTYATTYFPVPRLTTVVPPAAPVPPSTPPVQTPGVRFFAAWQKLKGDGS